MARTKQSNRRSHLPMQFKQTHTHSPPTVRVPAGDDAFPSWWRGKSVAVHVINQVRRCRGYFVIAQKDKTRATFVPAEFIQDVRGEKGPELFSGANKPHARYQLPGERHDDLGRDRSHEWVRARVLQETERYVLLELPQFNLDDWWSGYEVVSKDNKRCQLESMSF